MSCSRNAPKNFDEGYHSLSKWPTKMKSCTALVVTNRPQNHSVVFFRNRWLSSFGWCAVTSDSNQYRITVQSLVQRVTSHLMILVQRFHCRIKFFSVVMIILFNILRDLKSIEMKQNSSTKFGYTRNSIRTSSNYLE